MELHGHRDRLPVQETILFKLLLLIHTPVNGKTPVHVRDLLTTLDELHPTAPFKQARKEWQMY